MSAESEELHHSAARSSRMSGGGGRGSIWERRVLTIVRLRRATVNLPCFCLCESETRREISFLPFFFCTQQMEPRDLFQV